MKKRSPKEIIESTSNPKVEHAYVHGSGIELTNITKDSHEVGVDVDEEKKARVLKDRKSYSSLHTHPYGDRRKRWDIGIRPPAEPSFGDIFFFLKNSKEKYSHIAQTDEDTGEVGGYVTLAKTKKTDAALKKLAPEDAYPVITRENYDRDLRGIISNYHIQVRYSPAKGYKFDNEKIMFVKQEGLERKLSAITTILGFLASLFFLSSNFTGNVISNLTLKTSNIIGTILFLVGLIGAFFYFKKRK